MLGAASEAAPADRGGDEIKLDPIVYVDGWALIDVDPVTGRETYALADGDKMRVREVMPVDDLLAENAALQVDNLNSRHGDGYSLAARVPMHVWQKCLAPAILQGDKTFISRWLNDPDHAAFKTRAGLV